MICDSDNAKNDTSRQNHHSLHPAHYRPDALIIDH